MVVLETGPVVQAGLELPILLATPPQHTRDALWALFVCPSVCPELVDTEKMEAGSQAAGHLLRLVWRAYLVLSAWSCLTPCGQQHGRLALADPILTDPARPIAPGALVCFPVAAGCRGCALAR